MYISATEFRTNVGKYLDVSALEDIYIVKHGRPIAVLSANKNAKQRMADSLKGICKYDGEAEKIFEERLKEL